MALVKRIKRSTLRKEWRLISLLFAQLVVVMLVVVQLLQVIGLHVNFHLRQVAFKPSGNPIDFVILAIALLLFALLYFEVKRKQPLLFKAQKAAPSMIKIAAKEKLQNAKEDPRAPALLLIDFMFVATVVVAMVAYFDPELELIPWSSVGIGQPFTTIINAVIALAVLDLFYYMYRYTATYRKER